MRAAADAAVQNQGHLRPDGGADRGQDADRRRRGIELPPAMVRDDDAVHPQFLRPDGIGGRLQPFQDERFLPGVAYPGEIVPGQRLRNPRHHECRKRSGGRIVRSVGGDCGEARRRVGQEAHRPARVQGAVEQHFGRHPEREDEAVAQVALALAGPGRVDGEHQRLGVGFARPPDEVQIGFPVALGIELEPEAAFRRLADILD